MCVYFIMNPIIYGKNFNPCLVFKKSNPINLPLTAHPFHLIHHWIELKGKKNCIHKLSNLKAIKFLQFSSTSSPMLRRKNSSCLWPDSDDWWEVLFCFVLFLFFFCRCCWPSSWVALYFYLFILVLSCCFCIGLLLEGLLLLPCLFFSLFCLFSLFFKWTLSNLANK